MLSSMPPFYNRVQHVNHLIYALCFNRSAKVQRKSVITKVLRQKCVRPTLLYLFSWLIKIKAVPLQPHNLFMVKLRYFISQLVLR